MSEQNLSSDLSAADDAEHMWKVRREQFPLGLAPYKRDNLLAFGFFGGIIGAGIAGAINLRRSDQSRAVPSIILTTLAFLLFYWLILILILDRITIPGSQTNPGVIQFVVLVANVVLGLILATLIARNQRESLQRWLDLGGTLRWRDQGGCLSAVGWVILSGLLGGFLYYTLFLPAAPTLFQLMYPSQRYATSEVSVTIPAGWARLSPEIAGINCDLSGVDCIALVEERWSSSRSLFAIFSSVPSPYLAVNSLALPLKSEHPSLSNRMAQPYSAASLEGRDAATLSLRVENHTFVYTGIANSEQVIGSILICNMEFFSDCEALRDQFIAALEFAPESDVPDASELIR